MCTVLLFYHTKQIDLMLPWAFTVIYHRTWLNWASTSVTHLPGSCKSCGASLFLPSFDIICDLLLKRFTATRNLLVKSFAVFAVQVKAGGNERVATGVLIPFHTNFRKRYASWCKGKTKNLTLSCLSVKFTHHLLILAIITCHAFTLCHPLMRRR